MTEAAAGSAATPGRGLARRASRRLAEGRGLLGAAPWIGPSYLIFVLIMAFPIAWNIGESFFATSYGKSTFVGLSNFRQIIDGGQFWSSFLLTLYWTAGVFIGQFILGLLLALYFNRQLWISRFIRPLMLLPWAIPGIVSSTAWVFLYSQNGLVNQLLSPFVKAGPAWLADPHLAMPAVIVAGIWKGAPFYFLMLLAGLQSIPAELIEAARLDGASRWKILVRVELPYIRNILALTSALGLIWTANYFDGIYLMTGGGPVNDTTTLPIWIYNTAFSDFNLSEASALSVILLLLVLLIALPYLFRGEATMLRRTKLLAWNLGALVICFVMLVPFLWTVLESFHGSDVFGSVFTVFRPSLSNYRFVFSQTQLLRQFGNSFIACLTAMVLSVPVTAMAAYGYSRFRFRGRRVLFFGVLVTQILPATALVIPLYKVWSLGHLFNNLLALGVAYAAFNMALGILLVKNFLDNLPISLDEAALIDGCTRWKTFWYVLRPLVTPAIAATAVFVFVNAWQDYLLASSLITNNSDFTVNVGLYSFEGAVTTNWGAILATSVLVSLPSVVMFATAQRYFVRVVTGGVKG